METLGKGFQHLCTLPLSLGRISTDYRCHPFGCTYSFAFCKVRCSHKRYNCYMLPGVCGGMCPLRRRLLAFNFTLNKHASHLIFNLIWHSFASPRRRSADSKIFQTYIVSIDRRHRLIRYKMFHPIVDYSVICIAVVFCLQILCVLFISTAPPPYGGIRKVIVVVSTGFCCITVYFSLYAYVFVTGAHTSSSNLSNSNRHKPYGNIKTYLPQ